MTPEEYREALLKLNPEQFHKFGQDFGGERGLSIDYYVRNYVDSNYKHEGVICHLLGLRTEADKQAEYQRLGNIAEQDAAKSADLSAQHAARANTLAQEANQHADGANRIAATSNKIAIFSIVISVVALIVSAIAIYVAAIMD